MIYEISGLVLMVEIYVITVSTQVPGGSIDTSNTAPIDWLAIACLLDYY